MDQHGRTRRWMITSALVAGTVLGGAGIAAAQTDSSSSGTSSSSSTSTDATAQAPGQDPSTMANGPGETVLTGTEADQVTAAAKAAIPDGTVIRVETDNEGSPYEAHVKKADGTVVTLKFDSNFQLTETIDGFGKAPQGAPQGQAPAAAAASGASA